MTTRVRFCSSVAHLTFLYFTVTMKQLLQAPNVHTGQEHQLFSQQLKRTNSRRDCKTLNMKKKKFYQYKSYLNKILCKITLLYNYMYKNEYYY